ncbi:MAG: hypothetical protein K8I03_15260 [Ignavibacteria bacterium]|nr:hypothetical protein [Ignavibacteria bacterium]
MIFQLLCIIIAFHILKQFNVSGYLFLFLIALVVVTPMPALLFVGMEHSAQVFFALAFVFLSSKLLSSDAGKNDNGIKFLLIVTPILTGLRYESMFLVTVVSLLLLVRKKFSYSLLIFALGILPIVVYGFISTSHGWYFLPNPILLKSSIPGLTAFEILKFFYKAFKNITEPHIFLLLLISTILYVYNYRKQKDIWSTKQSFLLIVILTTIINMSMIEFHQNGWFYRYDAYLVALGFTAIVINVYDYVPAILETVKRRTNLFLKFTIYIIAFILISPLVLRSFSLFEVPFATKNIHDQHYQMSLFVKDHLKGINLAANDIGMIDFYSNSLVLDLYGLSNMEVAQSKLQRKYNTEAIDNITKSRDIKLAIVYENGYGMYGGLPPGWEKIAEWTMTDYNFVCGYETTTFFSVNKDDTEKLRKLLKEFSAQLPKSVIAKIF